MSWEAQFKIAILERDPEKIVAAHQSIPPLEELDPAKAQELYAYLEQSVEILTQFKKDNTQEMDRLKKVKQFLKTDTYQPNRAM